MLRVGLTGGIACGKTYVRQRLASLQIPTVDLDQVSRDVVRPGQPAYRAVVEAFGPVVAGDGTIDRRALGSMVFADAAARRRLNEIVHPAVRAEERQELRRLAGAGARLAVVDAALLIEGGRHLRFDRLVVVHCGVDLQLERLLRRDGLSRREAELRIAAQLPVSEKLRYASDTIDTSGTKEHTDEQVLSLAERLGSAATRERRPVQVPEGRAGAALARVRGERVAGVGPLELLQLIEREGGVDLRRLGARQWPGWPGEWYDAAGSRVVEDPPEPLSFTAALWRLGTQGVDRAAAVACAAAVARVTHRQAGEIAGACLLAEAVCELLEEGSLPKSWRERLGTWRLEAEKWGGSPAPERTARCLDAVAATCAGAQEPSGPATVWARSPLEEALLCLTGRAGGGRVADAEVVGAWRRACGPTG